MMDFIKKIESQLDMPTAEKEQVLREITSHYNEVKEELITAGATELEAGIEAEKRVGEPKDVAARLNATHASASWKSAFVCAVPFLSAAISYLLVAVRIGLGVGFILCGLMLLVSTVIGVRELVRGRRPIWLSAWLAGSIYLFCALVSLVTSGITNDVFRVFDIPFYALMLLLFLVGMRVRRWRVIVACVGFSYILSLIFKLWLPIDQIALLGLLVIAARAIFEIHPHGSAARASLFLFSAFMLFPILLPFVLPLDSLSAAELWYMAVKSLLYACPIILFARTPSSFYKGIIALVVLLLYPAFDLISPASGGWKWPLWLYGLSESVWCFIAVLFPIWLANLQSKRNRPSIAR